MKSINKYILNVIGNGSMAMVHISLIRIYLEDESLKVEQLDQQG